MKYIFIFLIYSASNFSFGINLDWEELLEEAVLNPNTQAFCYSEDEKHISGFNPNLKVRIASISKLYVTLWTLYNKSAYDSYKTKIHINNDEIHIEGSRDPYFSPLKLFFLLIELNSMGISKINKLTFDENFLFYDNRYHSSYAADISPLVIKKRLQKYLNNKSWNDSIKTDFENSLHFIKKHYPEFYNIKTVKITTESINYINLKKWKSTRNTFILESPKLYRYLKNMNEFSNNYTANRLFEELGSSENFQMFLQNTFNINTQDIFLYTGSGLDSYIDGERKDNYSTCSINYTILKALKHASNGYGLSLSQIMAVPGIDQGTFRRRLKDKYLSNALWAKTGTLYHTSALSGILNTNIHKIIFGIFNQTQETPSAKIIQDKMVYKLFRTFWGPRKFEYNRKLFLTFPKRIYGVMK